MSYGFKITSGVLEGKIYKISAGLSLGRRNADLNLEDKKASSLHASVVENAGQLHLVDQNSRNGMDFNGEQVASMPITEGHEIMIGKTTLLVVELGDRVPAEVADPLETWREILVGFNKALIEEKGGKTGKTGRSSCRN
mgnify:CR=1 FL=1